MAIGRTEMRPKAQEAEKQPLQRIIVKKLEPQVVAYRKFYQTNPREALELFLTGLFLTATFIGEIFTNLPWGWYLVFFVWLLHFFPLPKWSKIIKSKVERKGKK